MYIKRTLAETVQKYYPHYPIIALVGPRQAGKTTLLRETLSTIGNTGYVSLDDPSARALFNDDFKKFETQYITGHECYGIDEVQYGNNAGINLKYLADSNKKLIITSSTESLLAKEVLSFLVGRVFIAQLYPFSLQEFLEARGQKALDEQTLQRHVWEHFLFGGYPKVVLTDNQEIKRQILLDLYSTMVLKDAANTFAIADVSVLERLARYLSLNIGNIIAVDKISADLSISFPTVKKYLDALEKGYLIKRIGPFFSNKTKEMTKQQKYYFVDTGMANAVAGSYPDNITNGRSFENYVLGELIKSGHMPKYWTTRAGAEVDFVVEINNKPIPIEVKINSGNAHVEQSMRSFISEYSPKNAYVVHYKGISNTVKTEGCHIHFLNVLELINAMGKNKH